VEGDDGVDEMGVWGSHVVVPQSEEEEEETDSELESEYAQSVCTDDLEMEA
jgi:hypothetical protein